MDGCMALAMMMPAMRSLWRDAGPSGATLPTLKPVAGYLVPWLIALAAQISAQAAVADQRFSAGPSWAFLAGGILLCLLPCSGEATEASHIGSMLDFRDGAKRGTGCVLANFGAILPMAVLDMSLPEFLVMGGAMAACHAAPRKFYGPLMALGLIAAFALPNAFTAATGLTL